MLLWADVSAGDESGGCRGSTGSALKPNVSVPAMFPPQLQPREHDGEPNPTSVLGEQLILGPDQAKPQRQLPTCLPTPAVCMHVVLGLRQAEGAHLGLTSSCVSKSLHLPLGQGLTSTAGLRPDSGLMGLDHEPRDAGVQGHLSVLLGTPERPQDT